MADEIVRVSVRILEKEYQVSCPASEREALLDSANLLNQKMREIRDSGKVIGLDRIAVMAALNLSHDVLASRELGDRLESDFGLRIKSIRERVESALENGKQLEL